MKIKNLVLAAVMATTVFVSNVLAAKTEVVVSVNGMVCSFCAQGITKKFTAVPAVENVKVVLDDYKVYLTLKDDSELSDKEITKIIKDAGYDVKKIERLDK